MRLLLSFLKNYLSSWEIDVEYIWYGYDDESKILLAVWIQSVMMKIQLILGRWIAWLIPHLITKSSTLVDVILTVWCIVLMTRLLWIWMCDINITTWFLILVSVTTTTDWEFNYIWKVILSRWHKWLLTSWFFPVQRIEWKTISENIHKSVSW